MSPTAVASEYDRFTESSIVRDIPLSLLAPSPTNPRKHFEPEPLQELASDIRARGILAPLRVRPRGEAFEIVFGERRFRAAQIATLSAAPCIIGDLSDLEVLELQIAENLQRADMTPIEESDAFARLQAMDPKYREVKALAAQVGKSVTTVRERLRLQALVPDVREALDADEITVGHALLIAQLEAKGQAAALKECFYPLYGAEKGEREVKPLKDFERWFNEPRRSSTRRRTVAELFPELAGAVAKVQAPVARSCG
jgi:ParB family chromosome partitioning protein